MNDIPPSVRPAVAGITTDSILFGIEGFTNSFSLDEENRGFLMAFDECNDAGGIHGRRIATLGYPRAGGDDVDTAVVNARRLIQQDKVFALLNFGGPEAMVVAEMAKAHRVPHLFPHTTLFANHGNRYAFTSLPYCADEMRVLLRFVTRDHGLRRIALVRDVNEYGDIYQALLQQHAADYGYTLGEVRTLDTRNPGDLSDLLRPIAEGDSDAVFMALYPAQARALMAAKAKLGWTGTMIASAPLTDEQYLGAAGPSAEGTLGLCHFPDPEHSPEPGMQAYRAAMATYHPDRPVNRYTLYGYVFGRLALDGLRRAGRDLDQDGFVTALEGTRNWQSGGIIPPVTLGPDDHQAQRAALPSRLENGRFVHSSGWSE